MATINTTIPTPTCQPARDIADSVCPCCGHTLHQFEQASMFEGRPAHHMSECHNEVCTLFMVTLNTKQLLSLTPEQIAGYATAMKVVRR